MDQYFLDWEMLHDRKEKPHVMSMPYSAFEQIEQDRGSPWMQSLNGTWKFNLSQNAASRPLDFYQTDTDMKSWDEIEVPGLWQLQGFDQDPPCFSTEDYPAAILKSNIPSIQPSENTVGSYKKSFFVPETWKDREIFICFGGIKAAFYIWVNGKRVGYSQGSMTPAEFNITGEVKINEENLVSVEVYRYCDSTYLEGQSTGFLSGIYRDVYLYAEPKIYLRDYFLFCEFDNCYEDAFLKVKVEVVNSTPNSEPIALEIYLAKNEDELFDGYLGDCRMIAKTDQPTSVVMETLVKLPIKWTAENPFLYLGALSLKNSKGQILTIKKFSFGFRTVDIEKGKLLINGQPIKLKGVHRLNFDFETGCTITRSKYENDIKRLKRCNVNAIRTSHSPNDTYFYELCDQYGIYVMDEAGIHIHSLGKQELLGNRIEWQDAMVDRMTRMVGRDRNHPCVIIWSLGNEEGLGKNFLVMKKEALRFDGTRPFHYEGDLDFRTSDFFSSQSGSLEWLDAVGNKQVIEKALLTAFFNKNKLTHKKLDPVDYQDKPALLCAYTRGVEGDNSDIRKVMEKLECYDNWCGSFIKGYMDKSMNENTEFLLNNEYDLKRAYQCFEIQEIDLSNHQIAITPKSPFINLNTYHILWEVLEDGEVFLKGQEDIFEDQGSVSQIVELTIENYEKIEGAEYHLNVNVCLKEATSWGEVDHVVAWEQMKIPSFIKPKAKRICRNEMMVYDRKIKTEIVGEGFSCRISKLTGDITSLVYDKKEYLVSPLKLNFHCTSSDHDLEITKEKRVRLKPQVNWKKVSESYKVEKVMIENLKTEVMIQVMRKVKYIKDSVITEYMINGDGNLYISHQLTPKRNLVKFGTSLEISNEFSLLSWFGSGQPDNYSEKQATDKVGVYSYDVKEQAHNKETKTQDYSNKSEIRWFSATTQLGEGLFFEDVEGTLLSMNACCQHNTNKSEDTGHYDNLREKSNITLNIDYKQHQQHNQLVKNVEYKYGYKICRAY